MMDKFSGDQESKIEHVLQPLALLWLKRNSEVECGDFSRLIGLDKPVV